MLTIWQQYKEIARIFNEWGHENALAVTNIVQEFCADGIGLQECPTQFRDPLFRSPSDHVQYLLDATNLHTHMALRVALEGYSRLSAEKKAELLTRKTPTTTRGWR